MWRVPGVALYQHLRATRTSMQEVDRSIIQRLARGAQKRFAGRDRRPSSPAGCEVVSPRPQDYPRSPSCSPTLCRDAAARPLPCSRSLPPGVGSSRSRLPLPLRVLSLPPSFPPTPPPSPRPLSSSSPPPRSPSSSSPPSRSRSRSPSPSSSPAPTCPCPCPCPREREPPRPSRAGECHGLGA
jgi:hypothetical protein